MGPTFIKLGQSFATRSDIIDPEFANQLLNLCDNISSASFVYIKRTIERELKAKTQDIFLKLEEVPVASASIAQVHKAQTKCGKFVAVKVLKKNIEKRFKTDIKIILFCARIASFFLPKRLNVVRAIKRFAQSANYELDLRMEASFASELKSNTKNDYGLLIPKVFWDLTAQRVLTTEWIDGVPLTKFKQNNQKIVNRLVLMFFKQVYRDGFFHADVHPGNIFITSDEKIALVDFGIVGRVDDQTKIYLLEVIKGFLNRDYKSVAETHFRAGYVDRKFVNFSTACRAIGEPIVGKPLNQISVSDLLAQLFKLAADFEMEIQPHLLLLQKNLMMLEGNCAKIAPNTNMWKVMSSFIRQWYSTEMRLSKRLTDKVFAKIRSLQF